MNEEESVRIGKELSLNQTSDTLWARLRAQANFDEDDQDGQDRKRDTTSKETIIQQTKMILKAIQDQDWTTYAEMCDDNLTAFEPEVVSSPFGS